MSGQLEKRKYTRYSKSLRMEVVECYLTGKKDLWELLRDYNISSHKLIHLWVQKHEQDIRRKLAEEHLPLPIMNAENSPKDKLQALEEENQRLKDLLYNSNLKIDALETLIDLAEQTYRLPIRKNYAAKQSRSSGKGTEK